MYLLDAFECAKPFQCFIEKEDTILRNSISAHERLTATLRFLATGCSYKDSPQALGQIIPETCHQIFESLEDDYLQVSNNFFIVIWTNGQIDIHIDTRLDKSTDTQKYIIQTH